MFGLSENSSWMKLIRDSHQINGLKRLQNILNQKNKGGEVIFPPQNLILNAFELTDFNQIKVVIIGKIHIMAWVRQMVWRSLSIQV